MAIYRKIHAFLILLMHMLHQCFLYLLAAYIVNFILMSMSFAHLVKHY